MVLFMPPLPRHLLPPSTGLTSLVCCCHRRHSGSLSQIHYHFSPRYAANAEYKIENNDRPIYDDGAVFTGINRHGIRIVVRQSGTFRSSVVHIC